MRFRVVRPLFSGLLTVALAATLVQAGAAMAAGPTQTVAAERQSLVVFNPPREVDGLPVYGANQKIELIGGFLPIFAGCADAANNERGPVLIVNSDIIVTRQAGIGVFEPITTTVSLLGGLNLGTSIGFTGPTGAFPTGTYDVVYDECQDGKYTPGQDARFTSAFRVVVPVDAPLIDLGATKRAAQETVAALDAGLFLNEVRGTVESVAGVVSGEDITGPILDATDGATGATFANTISWSHRIVGGSLTATRSKLACMQILLPRIRRTAPTPSPPCWPEQRTRRSVPPAPWTWPASIWATRLGS